MSLFLTLRVAFRQLAGVWLFYLRYWPTSRRFKSGLPALKRGSEVALLAPGKSVLTTIPEASPMHFDYTLSVNSFIFHDLKADIYFLELCRKYSINKLHIDRIRELQLSKVYIPSHSLKFGSKHNKLLADIDDIVQIYHICPLAVRSSADLGVAFKTFAWLKRLKLMPRYTMLSPGASVSRILAYLKDQQAQRILLFGVDGDTDYFFQASDDPGIAFDTRQTGPVHETADPTKKIATVDNCIEFLNAQCASADDWITKM